MDVNGTSALLVCNFYRLGSERKINGCLEIVTSLKSSCELKEEFT